MSEWPEGTLIPASVLAEEQAELLGLDHARGAARLSVRDEGVRDVARHPLLVRQAVTDGVDEARDAAEPVQPSPRQVGDVRMASKGHEVVRADAVHGDAANDDEVLARVLEALAEDGGRVLGVPREQTLLPERAHP
jgi:hypothetical protein